MEHTLDEKKFIIENKPDIEIAGISCGMCIGSEGDGESGDLTGEFSFTTQEAIQAEINNKSWETVFITFDFIDHGAKLPQKYVSFNGGAQFMDVEDGEVLDYTFTSPTYVFDDVADKDGKFSVTFSMCLDEELTDGSFRFEKMMKDNAAFIFNNVWFGNEYVIEKVESIVGNFSADEKEITADMEGITYSIVGENEDPGESDTNN